MFRQPVQDVWETLELPMVSDTTTFSQRHFNVLNIVIGKLFYPTSCKNVHYVWYLDM